MMPVAEFSTPNTLVEASLSAMGFRFNPFAELESLRDPNLSRYLISDHLNKAPIKEPGIVLAKTGAGKTALRLGVFRHCWAGYGTSHPFPVPLMLLDLGHSKIDSASYIGRRLARSLLAALINQPSLLTDQSPSDAETIVTFLASALSGPLSLPRLLQMLDTNKPVKRVVRLLMPGYRMYNDIPLGSYTSLLPILSRSGKYRIPATKLFDFAQQIIIPLLGFSSILLQMDGADAEPRTMKNRSLLKSNFEWLLRDAALLAEQKIIVTAYLPEEFADTILEYSLPVNVVTWSTSQLIRMVQQRVFVASERSFNTLATIAESELSDIDQRIVNFVTPLPREVIFFIQCLLKVYAGAKPEGNYLNEKHLLEAQMLYQASSVNI